MADNQIKQPERPAGTTATPSESAKSATSEDQAKLQESAKATNAPPPSVTPGSLSPAAGVPLRAQVELDREARQRNAKQLGEQKESESARAGAQAVADAVTKVAQAAAQAAKSAGSSGDEYDFNVIGSVGGKFRLEGPARSFGTSGTVTFGGRPVQTDGWSAEKIYGQLPADVQPNTEVIVQLSEGVERKGFFRG